MEQPVREQLAHFCYVGVLVVIGAVALAIAAGNHGSDAAEAAGVIGGWALVFAVIYLVVTLVRLARALGQSGD